MADGPQMTAALQDAFEDYLALLPRRRPAPSAKPGSLAVLHDNARWMRGTVEECERTAEFARLVHQTRAQYSERLDRDRHDTWRWSVQHVLRRARIYAAVLDGRGSAADLLADFAAALAPTEVVTCFLAPMEFVQLAAREPLDFDGFRIAKFSPAEFSLTVENDTRETFFPDSVLDADLLSQYWWLVVPDKQTPRRAGHVYSVEIPSIQIPEPVERRYSGLPSAIAQALRVLVLADWGDGPGAATTGVGRYLIHQQRSGWSPFAVPFVLRAGGSLTRYPFQPPDLSDLVLAPVLDRDGVEVGERPMGAIYLDRTETARFASAVARFQSQLNTTMVQGRGWLFMDLALNYLVKAFVSTGFDQLLWHITAIEALLGDRADQLAETLARRCGLVLGCSKEDRQAVHDSFKALYSLRCDLVHGNVEQREAHEGHLAVARHMARDVAVWVMEYLCFVAGIVSTDDPRTPTRSELLAALDMPEDKRERVEHLLARLPRTFPAGRCWHDA